jgi:arginine metabolism regulation protein II
MCAVSGVACGGYQKSLFFGNKGSSSGGSEVRFRRTVLTEAERESMSRSLTASIPPSSAFKWILQLEDECQNISNSHDIAITRGPFGVFRSAQDSLSPDDGSPLNETEDTSVPSQAESQQNIDYFELPPNEHDSTYVTELVGAFLDEPQPVSDLQVAGLWTDLAHDDGIQRMPDESNIPEVEEIVSSQLPLLFQPYAHHQPSSSSGDSFISISAVNSLISVLGAQNSAPPDATFLLKHYSANVLGFYSPFRDAKTPWHILVVPQAKNCLASLSIGELPDHASLCTFYGVLAISALSLGNIMGSLTWMKNQANLYRQRAQNHCQQMMSSAYEVPKTAKYKAILMALVTMIQLALAVSNRDQCECYFLEAEKFIRLKGLNRRKSRKVRLLHHCYAYERIIWETTSICDLNSAHRLHVRTVVETSGLVTHYQDSPTFRLPKWKDLEQEMFKVRSLEEAENDLLSEQLGIIVATLYPEIFGVPEPFVLLISLIVRLGREKEAAETRSTPDPLDLADFLRWSKLIEKGIAELNTLDPAVRTVGMDHRVVDQHQLNRVLTALRNAIEIYFYRRIYEHEAPRLQQKIELIRDALFRDGTERSSSPFGSAQLIWSAFIAGCEVEDLQMQTSFSMWFEESARKSGLNFFSDAAQKLHRVWKIKQGLNGEKLKWMDLMKRADG